METIKNDISRIAIDQSAYVGVLDFCTNPDAARENFIRATTIIVNTFFPPTESPGYSEFMARIFVPIVTMVKSGTVAQMETYHKSQIEVFLSCFFIAGGRGMKDPSSDSRKSLSCFVREISLIFLEQDMAVATFHLLRDLIHADEDHHNKKRSQIII